MKNYYFLEINTIMTICLSRRILAENIIQNKWNVESVLEDLIKQIVLTEEAKMELQKKLKVFVSKFRTMYQKHHRKLERIPSTWLDSKIKFEWPTSDTPPSVGRKKKELGECSNRTTRRKLADQFGDIQLNSKTTQLLHERTLHKEGKRTMAKVIHEVSDNPSDYKHYTVAKTTPPQSYTPTEALALIVRNKLSKKTYQDLRNGSTERGLQLYPTYNKIREEKTLCYPSAEAMSITEDSARVNLQSLVDLTLMRTSTLYQPVLIRAYEEYGITNWEAIWKFGMDGTTGQSVHKQKFTDSSNTDASIFVSSCVLLRIQAIIPNCPQPVVVYKNPAPSDSRSCRPIFLMYRKETAELSKTQTAILQDEIRQLQPTYFDNDVQDFIINSTFHLTMLDGKLFDALTDNNYAASCNMCGELPKDMNYLIARTVPTSYLMYSLSPLHAWIRSFEWMLHVAYKLETKQYRKNKDTAETISLRKRYIQNEFWKQMGLVVDKPKPGGAGSSNDGNTARRFFNNPKVSSRITGIDIRLIEKIATILKTINCGFPINPKKFGEFCKETAELYTSLYPWYPLPPSVHKIFIHGEQIVR